MPYTPTKNVLDLELRAALRRVMLGTTFYESARFHGVRVEELYSFYKALQQGLYERFQLKNSSFRLARLLETKEPTESFLRYMLKNHGIDRTISFCSSFYLNKRQDLEKRCLKVQSDYVLPRDQFSQYIGCKVVAYAGTAKTDLYIRFGEASKAIQSAYPFRYECETYDDFIKALDGNLGIDIVEVTGFMSSLSVE